MYRRIVVPLDGSDTAEQALSDAVQLARLTGAPIHLVRVIDLTQLPWYGQIEMAMDYAAADQALTDENSVASAYLQTIAQRITESGLIADTEVLLGLSSRELVAISKSGDLFVMASHGRSGMPRWFLGSVAEDVLRRALVPVLLIKAGENRATQTEAPTNVATESLTNHLHWATNDGRGDDNEVADGTNPDNQHRILESQG